MQVGDACCSNHMNATSLSPKPTLHRGHPISASAQTDSNNSSSSSNSGSNSSIASEPYPERSTSDSRQMKRRAPGGRRGPGKTRGHRKMNRRGTMYTPGGSSTDAANKHVAHQQSI
jgi:hypothetical protein